MTKAIELIKTQRGMAWAEDEPRYDVMLHGKKFDQLYFNLRGYVGYLPTPEGRKLSIGERGIGAYQKEVAKLNREFAAAGRNPRRARYGRRRKARRNPGYELFYGSGGHGGRYAPLRQARQAARRLLAGSRSERSIDIRREIKESMDRWPTVATVRRRARNPQQRRQDAWNVYLRGKWIDTVYYTSGHSASDVKRGLVEHDGYDPRITVRRRARNPQFYRTFKRSATGWSSFARARKITESTGLTYEQARNECERYNANRTPAQIRKGTKMEFEAQ